MHPYKQLLRQPLRTLAALIILTASIAFMCLSWGVYRSGLATAKAVDEGFVTIMEYDNDYLMNNKVVLKTDVYDSMTGRYESVEWEVPLSYELEDNGTFDKIAEALPQSDCFEGYYTSRYANALIPGYVPVISSVERYSFELGERLDKPYNSAVVVFKITDVSLQDCGENKYSFTIEGDILERPAFCSEFNNKIDKIVLHSFIDSRDRIEAVRSDYEIGRTYIANLQCSYIDYDVKAKNYISNRLGPNVSYADVDWSKLKVGAEKALEYDVYPLESVIGASIEFDGRIYGIEEQLSIDLGTCGGSFDFPGLKYEQDGAVPPSENPPLIAEIPGTLEEFLADPANKAWVDVVDNTNAQFNTSVVIGTDKIYGLRLFYDKTMYLADGEDFSKEDYKSGSNVCIVSESAAYKNGWNIGDKITLSYYNGYVVPEIGCTERLPDVYNPEDDFGIMCQYEIKGIYRHTNIFSGDVDDITPNTVFVPNKNLDMIGLTDAKEAFLAECGDYFRDYAEEFNIKSMILKNGRVDDMKAFIEEHGWDLNWFKFYDGGYSQVQGIVEGMKGSAGNQLLASGITALTALIIYISLFVMRQRKNVGSMLSLGSGKSKAAGFMICVSTIPAAVATALGAIIGCALLRSSVNKAIMGATQQFDNTFSGAAAMGHGELENVIVLPSAAIIAALVLLAVYIVSFTAAAFITVNKNTRNLMKK